MFTPKQAHDGINIGFHVWILLIFLAFFFFKFVAQREAEIMTDQLNKPIQKEVPIVLSSIHDLDQQLDCPSHQGMIDWEKVSDMANELENENGPDHDVVKHNRELILYSVILCVTIFILLVGAIIYFSVHKKYDIRLKEILINNMIIFILVGIIEALFFWTVALKHVSVIPAKMVNDIIDRVEYHVNKDK